ncbi:MAG: T9SS type A sorting domain-containing protein [Bacteroidia bacterium]
MEKHLRILYAISIIFSLPFGKGRDGLHAQVINPDFSTWSADILAPSANNPNAGNGTTGWDTYNFLNNASVGGSPISVLRCDTAYTGSTYSARIQTVVYTPTSYSLYVKDWGIPFIGHVYSDTLGLLWTGTTTVDIANPSGSTFIPGFPFTQKISQLTFYYQYKPNGVDSAECRVELRNASTPLAGGLVKISAASSVWQQAVVPISYVNTILTPDTLWIIFSSSSFDSKPMPGSILWIDNVGVTPLGIEPVMAADGSITVYPDPACNTVNFNIAGINNAATLSIFDITGEKINSFAVHNCLNIINTETFSNGIYFYRMYDNTGGIIKTGKFSVIR